MSATVQDRAAGSIVVPHDPRGARLARQHLAADLGGLLPADLLGDLLAVASELVGNAVRHAGALPGGVVRVVWRLAASGPAGAGLVEVRVTDGGAAQVPAARTAGPDGIDGRGLAIVSALAKQWGVSRDAGEQCVWAQLGPVRSATPGGGPEGVDRSRVPAARALPSSVVSKRRRGSRSAPPQTAGRKRAKVHDVFVPRPFAGLAGERDWVALRELVPAATAPVRLAPAMVETYGDREIVVATLLPLAWPAVSRPDGRILVGLQRAGQSGDPSRDIAVALIVALEGAPGALVRVPAAPGPGPRLQDLLADADLAVTTHDGFDFWLDGQPADPEVTASLERANASMYPTAKLTAAPAAYWCRLPGKSHLRWVLGEPEDSALAGLSRLSAAGRLTLGDGTRFAGMFRAHGLLVPVWDLPSEPDAARWEQPLADLAGRYAEALDGRANLGAAQLTPAERRARQGLVSRQVTLR